MCEEVMVTMGWLFGWSSPVPAYVDAQSNTFMDFG